MPVLAGLALLVAPSAAFAQAGIGTRIDPRWQAYVGCWADSTEIANGSALCVVPTADSVTVELQTVADRRVVQRALLAVTDTRSYRTRNSCRGWDLGRWSADERRLYVHTEYVCSDSSVQTSESMFAMTGPNRFTRIDVASAGSDSALRVSHRAAVRDTQIIPLETVRRLPATDDADTWAARNRAAVPLTMADVADASSALDPVIVDAWLITTGQQFWLNQADVRALRDVAVPASVIDRMLGRSHEELFAVTVRYAPPRRSRHVSRSRLRPSALSEPSGFSCGSRACDASLFLDPRARGTQFFPNPALTSENLIRLIP